jgi:hypothetical protein
LFRQEGKDCFGKKAQNDTKDSPAQFKKTPLYYTILRDPVERVISEYFWWYGNKHSAWTDGMKLHHQNITAWIVEPTNVAHNRQALTLLAMSGAKIPTPISGRENQECLSLEGNLMYEFIAQKYGSIEAVNTELDYMVSAEYMEALNIGFVGVMEDMPGSLRKLDSLIHVDRRDKGGQPKKGNQHKSKKNAAVAADPKIRALIAERNRLDMLLYYYARSELV